MSYGPIGVYHLSLGICFSLVVYVFIIAPENINARQLLKINDNCQKITKLSIRSCAICLKDFCIKKQPRKTPWLLLYVYTELEICECSSSLLKECTHSFFLIVCVVNNTKEVCFHLNCILDIHVISVVDSSLSNRVCVASL